MSPVSPIPAIVALVTTIVTAFLIARYFGSPPAQGRFASIDGLRGYLAIFIVLHHSSIWYFALQTTIWRVPPSPLYTHFGRSSVAVFFMITGFLFYSKILDGRTKGIDWGNLFISRFLRIVPMYLFVMLLLFIIVAFISKGVLNEPLPKLIKGAMCWLGFTIFGQPELNGFKNTLIIVAGVTWPLPYEWFFYFSLPLLSLTVGLVPKLPYLMLGIVGLVCLSLWHPDALWYPDIYPLLAFLGGIAASFLVRIRAFCQFATGHFASLLVLGFLTIMVVAFPSPYGIVSLFLLSLAFSLIAGGNSMFGLLVSPASRTLGEISYSIYLLQGIILFVIFFVIGISEVMVLSPITYWILITGILQILILISYCTFRLIERPAIQSRQAVTAWLRSCLTLSSKPGHKKDL